MDRLPPRVPTSSDDSPPPEKKTRKSKSDVKETGEKQNKTEKKEKKEKGKKEKKSKKPKADDAGDDMEPLVRKDDDEDDGPDDESTGGGELSGVDELVALTKGQRTKKRPATASSSNQPFKRPSKKNDAENASNADEKEASKTAIPLDDIWGFMVYQQTDKNKQYEWVFSHKALGEYFTAFSLTASWD